MPDRIEGRAHTMGSRMDPGYDPPSTSLRPPELRRERETAEPEGCPCCTGVDHEPGDPDLCALCADRCGQRCCHRPDPTPLHTHPHPGWPHGWCPGKRKEHTDMTQQEINRLAATTPAAHARREQQAARVGQVWKSADRREDRWVRVVEIDAQFAVVEPCEPDGEPHHNPRRTRVRLSPTGRLNRYRLVQDPPLPGLGERSERPTTPTPNHTTPEASSAAYGHAAAVKRPSPATPGRWQLPPEPDVPRLRDAAGLHALAAECSAHALAWDERDDPDGHAAAWDALHTLLTAAGAWVEHLAKMRPDLAPAEADDIVTAVRRLAAHLTAAEEADDA